MKGTTEKHTGAPFSLEKARLLIADRFGPERVPKKFKVRRDTSDFFRVDYNDVVLLGDRPYWIKRYEKEGRFGLDDEPKYWVRRAIDLTDGSTKVIKLVFHEEYKATVGSVVIRCFRSPGKEARILDLVADHENFMHGSWVLDEAGNNVRILEFIYGPRYDDVIVGFGTDHEDYFHNYFREVLDQYIELVNAIKFLHDHGEKHGDVRRDHILWDRERKVCRWIDFDYNYEHRESMFGYDLQGLGSILMFLAGRGDVVVDELYHKQPEVFKTLWGEDLSIVFKNRVANLKKIYPYIPDSLNWILLHFSVGANIFYETTDQMLHDLEIARADIQAWAGRGS